MTIGMTPPSQSPFSFKKEKALGFKRKPEKLDIGGGCEFKSRQVHNETLSCKKGSHPLPKNK